MLGHAKKIFLSNLHNIHKLPNIFDFTYICLEEKLVILWRTYFQRLELILSDSSNKKKNFKEPNFFLNEMAYLVCYDNPGSPLQW